MILILLGLLFVASVVDEVRFCQQCGIINRQFQLNPFLLLGEGYALFEDFIDTPVSLSMKSVVCGDHKWIINRKSLYFVDRMLQGHGHGAYPEIIKVIHDTSIAKKITWLSAIDEQLAKTIVARLLSPYDSRDDKADELFKFNTVIKCNSSPTLSEINAWRDEYGLAAR